MAGRCVFGLRGWLLVLVKSVPMPAVSMADFPVRVRWAVVRPFAGFEFHHNVVKVSPGYPAHNVANR